MPRLQFETQLLQELPSLANAISVVTNGKISTVFLTFKVQTNYLGEPVDGLADEAQLWIWSIKSQAKSVSDIIKDSKVLLEIEKIFTKITNGPKVPIFEVLPFNYSISTNDRHWQSKKKQLLASYKSRINDIYLATS
ncbi:hypothetical protein HCN44_001175 [Aphidius gifuensis]|uniref:Uncharacterized protein n=1 Tax=Aphidius gifuensis TaxID=684658 RepID=A0A834XKN6_APHGI|nr:hypothetical protein HCN44_001175 [Aphidius gifuensis]